MPSKGSRKLDAKRAARLRRHELEEEKRRRVHRERRNTWLLAGLGVLVGGAIVAAVVVEQAMKPVPASERTLASYGASAADSGCTAVQTPKAVTNTLIGPGTGHPQQTKGSYPAAPPVGGDHYQAALPLTPAFYGPKQRPAVERLVTNELQGDTVVWYRPSISGSQQTTLSDMASKAAPTYSAIVAPWWPAKPSLPAGKNVAIATKGHVQYCSKASGAVLQAFLDRYGTGASASASADAPASVVPPAASPTTAASPTPAAQTPTASPAASPAGKAGATSTPRTASTTSP